MEIRVKHPTECSQGELDDFERLVREGDEVNPNGLSERIRIAQALAFAVEGGSLCGVAALKNPHSNYKTSVFQKSNAISNPGIFDYELGWVFVRASSRGNRLSHKLVAAAMVEAGEKAVFATSSVENHRMHRVLRSFGFVRHGDPYLNEEGNRNLMLFVLDSDPTRAT